MGEQDQGPRLGAMFSGIVEELRLVRKSNTSLLSKNNSLERAVDWIFSHIDDLDAEAAMDISEGRSAADSISESVPVGPKVRDGPGSECSQETGKPGGTYHCQSLGPSFQAALLSSGQRIPKPLPWTGLVRVGSGGLR